MQAFEKNYKFRFYGKYYQVDLSYTDEYYKKCKSQTWNWQHTILPEPYYKEKIPSDYVKKTPCLDMVQDVQTSLQEQFDETDLEPIQEINLYITFVNSITYAFDIDQYRLNDYWATPFETLVSGKGDCEDTSVLLSTLFSIRGWNSALITLPGHEAVCVNPLPISVEPGSKAFIRYGGYRYYYCESTGCCRDMGELPEDVKMLDITDKCFISAKNAYVEKSNSIQSNILEDYLLHNDSQYNRREFPPDIEAESHAPYEVDSESGDVNKEW